MQRLCFLAWFPVFALGLIVGLACLGSDLPVTESQSTQSAEESGPLEVPVEALPDPLPEPYLFRDEVTIETEAITETIYVVQPGDTLAGIAGLFCITLIEIQRLNTIVDVTQLSIGEELRIPIREGACGAASPTGPTTESPADPAEPKPGEAYVVQAGDTLADIAAAYGFTWRDLMTYNDLTEAEATSLQVGQTLIIPPQPQSTDDEQAAQQQDGPSEPPG